MPSVQVQIEDRIKEVVVGMNLKWPLANQIYCRRLPWDNQGNATTVILPGLTIYPMKPAQSTGTNRREDIGYQVGLAFIRPAAHSNADERDVVHSAREAVRRKLMHDRLTIELASGHFCDTQVIDLDIHTPKEAHAYEVSGLLVRGWVREART